MNVRPWRDLTSDVGATLARSRDPITFLIGAGCSITSGCPSVPQVDDAIKAATNGRLQGNHRNLFHEIPSKERLEILQPLFRPAKPYVGYYSLAALARERAVIVLSLNWDLMPEQSCAALGIPCTSFDLFNPPAGFDIVRAVQRPGLICIHLHGSTETDPRFAKLHTLKFEERERHLLEAAMSQATVVVGTTLVADADMTHLLLELAGKRPHTTPIWQFNRGKGGPTSPGYVGEGALTSFNSPLQSAPGFVLGAGDDMDFDAFMVKILSHARGKHFGDDPAAIDEFIWPTRTFLSECLPPKQLLVMTGEPQLGKSTTANFVSHLYALLRKPGEDGIQSFDQPHATIAALSSGAGASGIYCLEDPFGSTSEFEPNPGFFRQLETFSHEAPDSSVIVTSRRSNWDFAAINDAGAPRSLPSSSSDWYDKAALKSAVARVRPDDRSFDVQIEEGEIDTPARLRLALGGATMVVKARLQAQVVEEKVKLLRQHPDVATLCVLTRLQELASIRFSEAELAAISQLSEIPNPTADMFLKGLVFENVKGVALRNSTDQEAVDSYIASEFDRLRLEFDRDRARYPEVFGDALQFLGVLTALKNGDISVIAQLSSEQLQRRCAALFSAHPSVQILDAIGIERLDPWATVELAYEVVRLWPVLRKNAGSQTILERFAAHSLGRGTYALVEASLYLGGSVSRQVHGVIQTALWRLLERTDTNARREALLIVDAFAWRPMLPEYQEWVESFIDINQSSPLWAGFLRFCEAYHASGLAHLSPDTRVGVGALQAEEAEIVAWLVRWHFVHQAHSRMLLSRSRILDKQFLCRSLHPGASSGGANIALGRLVEALAQHAPLQGWAFHLCCNAMSMGLTVAESTVHVLRDLIGNLPKQDPAVTLAALTYQSTTVWNREIQAYFREQENRDFALNVLRDGYELDEGAVHEPRFTFVRHPAVLEADFKLQWPQLWKNDIVSGNVKSLVSNLRGAAERLVASKIIHSDSANRVIALVSRGDLREIEVAVVARDPVADIYEHIMLSAIQLREGSQGQLF